MPTTANSPRLLVSTVAFAAALSVGGCGEDPERTTSPTGSATTAPSATNSPAAPTTTAAAPEPDLAVRIAGDQVSPNAVTLEVPAGEPLQVQVESDRAGELHVHAKPEQYVEFDEGRTEVDLVINTPGTVEVEDHETGAVVALIEVN